MLIIVFIKCEEYPMDVTHIITSPSGTKESLRIDEALKLEFLDKSLLNPIHCNLITLPTRVESSV